jgi:hypothetical protein
MVSAGIGIVLLGATMGIHIEGVKDVPKKELGAILKRLKKGFEEKTGDKVKLDRKVGACVATPECIAKVRERTKASKLLFLLLSKGNEKANKLVTTIVFENGEKKKIGVKIPIERKIWDRLFPKLVSKLLKYKPKATTVAQAPPPVPGVNATPPPVPGATATPPPVPGATATPPPVPGATATPPPVPGVAAAVGGSATPQNPNVAATSVAPSTFSWAPWATIGGSLLAGGAGIYFGLQSSKARSSALSASHEVAEIEALNQDIYVNGLTANALLGTAALGIATGVVLFFLD